ncbi:MAG: hypothetical protein IT310_15290 [Anaerolineales bacterium]|nr:hypothetical protein [Anaerolineales bacterium]
MDTPNKVNRLLELIKRPEAAKRKPSNFALYWAWLFYNAVALLFDVIAAGTVYSMMGKFAYAVLTFAAGFLPLLMHEFLYTRAYASKWQKVLAIVGAGLSVVTILAVGVLAGIINILGVTVASTQWLEIGMIIALVLVAGGHGLIAAIYFYIDDGIKANQVRAESVAYHERRIEDIQRAKEILALAEQGANDEDAIAKEYGGMEVLNEILGQLRGDNPAPSKSAAMSANQAQDEDDELPAPEWQAYLRGYQAAKVSPPMQNAMNESEAAELQPVPLQVGFGRNGNAHK